MPGMWRWNIGIRMVPENLFEMLFLSENLSLDQTRKTKYKYNFPRVAQWIRATDF
jgi:hypothetical protein